MEDIACIHHNKDKYIYLIIPICYHILYYYILFYYIIYFKIKLIKLIWLGFVISPSTSMDPVCGLSPFPNIVVNRKWYIFCDLGEMLVTQF